MATPSSNVSSEETTGCGSGPVSCFLAARGLAVRGIDVSPTALEMARQSANERGLTVRFDFSDICRMSDERDVQPREGPALHERYDLIIDGHCLHYFVLDEHRRAALTAIHRSLKPGGLFLIETMISHPGLIVGANYRIDTRGVLSIKVDNPEGHQGAAASGGEW